MRTITKIVLGIVVLFLVANMLGGGSSNKSEQASTQTPSTSAATPAATPDTYKIGDRVVVGGRAYTVTNVKTAESVGDKYSNAQANGIFVIVDMTIENVGKESSTMTNSDVKIVDSEGRTFESDTRASSYINNDLFFKQIQPGLPAKGEAIFDVPKGITCSLQVCEGGWGTDTKLISLGTI